MGEMDLETLGSGIPKIDISLQNDVLVA